MVYVYVGVCLFGTVAMMSSVCVHIYVRFGRGWGLDSNAC